LAEFHLTKALELDRELAEPYPWLCYVLMRTNRFEAAVQSGVQGVQLQPDLVFAHYFLGLAYFAGGEIDAANYQRAARHLGDAVRVNPHFQPTWFVLSQLALLTGDYQRAEGYASRLLEMSRAPKGMPFIGAEIILGSVKLRERDATTARHHLLAFLEHMRESDHMYRDAMTGAAGCALGDVELRHGPASAALAAYRRGWYRSGVPPDYGLSADSRPGASGTRGRLRCNGRTHARHRPRGTRVGDGTGQRVA
jgi:tetratricopeptide (TPR) repeat protein